MSGMCSTASGFMRVDMSPTGFPRDFALITRRMILPDLVLGRSLTKWTSEGQLWCRIIANPQDDEGYDRLALHRIGLTDDGSLSDLGVSDKS